jgi:hypothetical protein
MMYEWVTTGKEPAKYTAMDDVTLITRENFKQELKNRLLCESALTLFCQARHLQGLAPHRSDGARRRWLYATAHPYRHMNSTERAGSLRFNGIGKTFPGVNALSDISFVAHPGQCSRTDGRERRGQVDAAENPRRLLHPQQR